MTLTYATHAKISLRTHAESNDAWLHDRICDDPTILGLRSNGVVRNIMWLSPKPMKKFAHLGFRHPEASAWHDRFEETGVPGWKGRKGRRFRVSVTPEKFESHQDLIREAIVETVKEFES